LIKVLLLRRRRA